MQVSLTRNGVLAGGRRPSEETVTLADGARASDLLAAVGIDPRTCVVVVNGTAITRTAVLHDGDRAALYPAQAGG